MCKALSNHIWARFLKATRPWSRSGLLVSGSAATGKWALLAWLAFGASLIAFGQTPLPKLTLKDAEALAIKNHPQILAAESEVGYANQQVAETRSAYYPTVDADADGLGRPTTERVSVRDSSPIRVCSTASAKASRYRSSSPTLAALPTSSPAPVSRRKPREQNLPGHALRRAAPGEPSILRRLHAQSIIRVAEETVAARQLLFDQVSSLAKNNLRSQLDVSFADVNVSEAKTSPYACPRGRPGGFRRAVARARLRSVRRLSTRR